MKNKKGFTFAELLAVITILGILVVVVIVSVSSLLEKAYNEYYDSQRGMMRLAGKEYFTDYRSGLPKDIGALEKVTLKTLIDEKYIDPIVDHKEQACDYNDSYVYAQKRTSEDYEYYAVLKCSSYVGKEINFSPNGSLARGQIHVEMTIESRKSDISYRYEVEKNGVVIKTVDFTSYRGPVAINLTEEGIYYITGYAKDSGGDLSLKRSEKYVIDHTPPDCSRIKIESDVSKDTWQINPVNLVITPTKDMVKWDLSTRVGDESYQSKSQGNKGSKTEKFTENGANQGKIKAYDEVGNYCERETDRYYIDNEGPVIHTFKVSTIYSTTPNIQLNITDLNEPIEIYLSKTGYKEGGSWESYKTSKSFNVSGSLDGSSKTIYLVARDRLGNESRKKYNYNIYEECSQTSTTYVEDEACSLKCGGGTQTSEARVYDSNTGAFCRSDGTTTNSCNVFSCCSSTYANYGSYGSCSTTCGSGNKSRSVTYYSNYTDEYCFSSTDWASCSDTSGCCTGSNKVEDYTTDYTSCSKTCGGGTKTMITYYKSRINGMSCGSSTYNVSCNTHACSYPSCSITISGGTTGENGWYKGGTVSYTMSVTNATSYGMNETGSTSYNGSKSGTVTSDGIHNIHGYVKSSDGFTSSCRVTVKYDKTPPTVPSLSLYKWKTNAQSDKPTTPSGLSSYSAGTVSDRHIFAYPNATDATSGVAYYQFTTTGSCDERTNQKQRYRNIVTSGADCNIKFRAVDNAGNISSYSSTKNIKIKKHTCWHTD